MEIQMTNRITIDSYMYRQKKSQTQTNRQLLTDRQRKAYKDTIIEIIHRHKQIDSH